MTKLEIELVQAQALHGPTEDSQEHYGGHNDSDHGGQTGGNNFLSPPQGSSSGKNKKGVSGKLKSFFANKFYQKKGGSKNGSNQGGGSAQNSLRESVASQNNAPHPHPRN